MLALKSLVTFVAMAVLSATAAPSPSPVPEAAAAVAVAPAPASGDFITAVALPADTFDIAAHPGQGCVKMCQDHFFQGTCYTFCTNDGQCATLAGGANDWASSLDVIDWPTWDCTYYEHAQCQGASFTSHYDDTLHDGNGWWADRISAIRCFYRCDTPFC